MTQSQKRFNESVGALFEKSHQKRHCLFLKSSSDVGVMRNGGRNGARFAPQAFLTAFRKFSQTNFLADWSFSELEVSDQEQEFINFSSAQKMEEQKIKETLAQFPQSCVWQIGGGHDHIYPFLSALAPSYQRVIVINIDAHADTRTDPEANSGTPFRQFASSFEGDYHLFQIGLHSFANAPSTLSPLSRGSQKTLLKRDLSPAKLDDLFGEIEKLIHQQTAVFFSLDADALNGYEVPGVSAVNPDGFSCKELISLWKRYQKLQKPHATLAGIYELNPVYDSLGGLSMKTMASFVFESFR